MSMFIVSQIIAVGALAAGVLTFQLKERVYIVGAFALMSSLLSLHFYVLGEYTASAIVAVSVVRFLVSAVTKRQVWMYVFLLITAAVGWYTYAHWYNMIAIAAGMLGVVATFQAADQRLRLIMMSSSTTMAIHDMIVGTPVGLTVDLTVLISGMIGYYRYYIRRQEAQ
ncbi:MAG: YgjV family protein [Candidatus Pacebacteria bacterium]|nr:YgjV family protein [Candidatus Paceibacterota bacterium]